MILHLFVVKHHRRSAQVWLYGACSQEISQFYLHTHTFVRNWNEPFLPLPSQPQLVQHIIVSSASCDCGPCAVSGVVRIDLLHFLAGCRTRRLNQALPVLSLRFFESACCAVITRATFFVVLFCVVCLFCLLVVLIKSSVPVQVIDWKDLSPK